LIEDKIVPILPMIIGPFIVGLGMSLFVLPGDHPNYFFQYLPGLILFGLGMSLVIAPLTKSALEVDKNYSGAASGVNNAVSRIAGLLAVSLLGAVMLSIFSSQLSKSLQLSQLSSKQKNQIFEQKNALGAIVVPQGFTVAEKAKVTASVDESFMKGFRYVMGINALLAFLSSAIAFITIREKRIRKSNG